MDTIMKRLQENYDTVVNMGYEIVGIFLQGSQNYELAYEGSDIDCKAIILPTFNDFVLNHKPVSTTHVLENNEHIDLKDIRLMFECFKKQNINFLEILFTKYRIINPKYEAFLQPLFDNREAIAHYNNYAALNCMAGMSMEKFKALEHPYPATIAKIEKFGYDPKQLHHIIRIDEFMNRYTNGESFADCLISRNPEFLIEVKKGTVYDLEQARRIAKSLCGNTGVTKNEYMKVYPVEINKEVDTILNSAVVKILKKSFKESWSEE